MRDELQAVFAREQRAGEIPGAKVQEQRREAAYGRARLAAHADPKRHADVVAGRVSIGQRPRLILGVLPRPEHGTQRRRQSKIEDSVLGEDVGRRTRPAGASEEGEGGERELLPREADRRWYPHTCASDRVRPGSSDDTEDASWAQQPCPVRHVNNGL